MDLLFKINYVSYYYPTNHVVVAVSLINTTLYIKNVFNSNEILLSQLIMSNTNKIILDIYSTLL